MEVEGTGSNVQEEALRALELLPDQEKIKVLEYIQELVNHSKNDHARS
jgi:hypothetical protein